MIYSSAYYWDDEDALLSGWRADEWILLDRRGQWVAFKLECNNTANKSIALSGMWYGSPHTLKPVY